MNKSFLHIIMLLWPFLAWAQQLPIHFYEEKCAHANTNLKTIQFTETEGYDTYDLTFNKIFWRIDPRVRYISGNVAFHFKALTNGLENIYINLHDSLNVDSILWKDHQLQFEHANHNILIHLQNSLNIGQTDSFTIYYQGIPPTLNSRAYETQLRNDSTPEMWTLSEPYGAMEWWPCKQSLQDKIDSVEITVEVPTGFSPASNGLPIQKQRTDSTITVHYKHNYPITTYLVAVAVSNYVEFSEVFHFNDGDSMLLINLVFPEYLVEAKQQSVHTSKIMRLFNGWFSDYPFKREWYGHAQFSRGGGMEHQTMSFMGDLGFELVAHEMAHQWFGDFITLNSWHDIFLNEGFATYFSGLCYEFLWPEWWYTWKKVRLDYILSETGGSVYVEDTTDVSRIFSRRLTYFKGGYLLHMLRGEIGDKAFFDGIYNYCTADDVAYGFTDIKQFIQHMEAAADTSLAAFFDDWYYGEGYPIYSTYWSKSSDSLFITLEQVSSHPSVTFFEMHVPITVITEDNDTIQLRLKNTYSGQHYSIPLSKPIKYVTFDPELQLCASNNTYAKLHPPNVDDFRIFPNPANKQILISNINNKPLSDVRIYSLSGKLVYEISTQEFELEINTSRLNDGLYLLRVGAEIPSIYKLAVKHQ